MVAFAIAREVPCKQVATAINAVRKTHPANERNSKVTEDSIRDAVIGTTFAAISQARSGDLLSGEVLRSELSRTGFAIEVSRQVDPVTGEQFQVSFRFGVASINSREIGTETDFSNVL